MEREQIIRSVKLDKLINQICIEKENIRKKCGMMSRIECALLLFLNKEEGGVCMNDLSSELKVSHSRVTRIIDSLVEKEIVDRYPSKKDRRKWYAELTEKGKRIADDTFEENLKMHKQLLSQLPDEQIDIVLECIEDYFSKYRQVLEEMEEF